MRYHIKKPVSCVHCGDEIVSQDDLITVLQWPDFIAPYHRHCYGERALGSNPARVPLNSEATVWLMIIFGVGCLIGFFVSSFSIMWVVLALIIPFLRLMSWILIERKVSRTSSDSTD